MIPRGTRKMRITKIRMLGAILPLGVAMLLAGCPFGGGSSTTTLNTVTDFHVPELADAYSTFHVQVSLAPAALSLTSPQSSAAGNAAYQGTRLVSVVDVSTSVPPISCSGTQPVTVGGDTADFSCRAPDAVPGADNKHHLQIVVPGTTDPVDNAYVEVISRGLVSGSLVDLSGNPIDTISPGQSFQLKLSAVGHPLTAGEYTVFPPDGWTVDGSDSCIFPTSDYVCTVTMQVPAGAPMGITDFIHVGAQSGAARLADSYFPIDVEPPSTSSALLASPKKALTLEYAENVSQTLYADSSSPDVTFNYKPSFTFRANEALHIIGITVDNLEKSSLRYRCNGASPVKNPDCQLQIGDTYALSGTLKSNYPEKDLPVNRVISIYVKDDKNKIHAKSVRVMFIKYVKDHIALRIVDRDNRLPLHVAATGQAGWISFWKKSGDKMVPTNIGGKPGGAPKFKTRAYPIKPERKAKGVTGIIYLPYELGGKVYIARGKNSFSYEAAPNIGAFPIEPPYLVFEATYQDAAPTGPNPPPCATPCDNLSADMSYVNSVMIPATFNAMGNAGNQAGPDTPLTTQDVTFGELRGQGTSEFLKAIDSRLGKSKWKGLEIVKPGNSKEVYGVRGPVSAYGAAKQSSGGKSYTIDPFGSDYYNDYIDKIWDYYKTHTMYVLASGTADKTQHIRPANRCVLQGKVEKDSKGDYVLKFERDPSYGSCPSLGYVKAGLAGQTAVDSCGVNNSTNPPSPGTAPCADTANLVFAKFNSCDFFKAAGSNQCHEYVDPTSKSTKPQGVDAATFFDNRGLWGPNGTYRAVVGRAIAAYQTAGLLPPPSSLPKSGPVCAPNATTILRKENAKADVAQALDNWGELKNTPCVKVAAGFPTYDVYSSALLPLVDVYTYSYSDFLGRDGTVGFSEIPLYPDTSLPRAEPLTVILQ